VFAPQGNLFPPQPFFGFDEDVSTLHLDVGSELPQAFEVEVHRPVPDDAAAGE